MFSRQHQSVASATPRPGVYGLVSARDTVQPTKLRCPASSGGEPELIKEDQKIGITNEPLELPKLLVVA